MDEKKDKSDEHSLINYKHALAFFDDNVPVHVTLGWTFYNGLILKKPNEKYFWIEDRVIGKTCVFFDEMTKPLVAQVMLEEKR